MVTIPLLPPNAQLSSRLTREGPECLLSLDRVAGLLQPIVRSAHAKTHSIPLCPALTTGVSPTISFCPPLPWMCPHTTSRGCCRSTISRTATLPSRSPCEERSTIPLGGE